MKKALKLLISVVVAIAATVSTAVSEPFDGGGFTLEIPEEFVRRPSTHPQAALVLQSKTQSFPTFNVVSESTPLSPDLTAEKFGEETLRGYKLVGLTDAALRSAVRIADDRFRAEISYSQSGERLYSIVEWVNASNRHYILTFIDREITIDRSRFLQAALARSFALKTPAAAPKKQKEPKSRLSRAVETSLLMLAIIGLAALIIRRWASR